MYYVNISIKWLKYESTNIFDTFPWSYGPLACWQYLFENFSSHWLQNNFILDIFESEIWKYQHCCIYLYIVYMLIYISIGVSDPDPVGSCVFAWLRIRKKVQKGLYKLFIRRNLKSLASKNEKGNNFLFEASIK